MVANNDYIRMIWKKIGADCEFKPEEILYADPRSKITLGGLYKFPEDTLIYLAADIPKDCPWKDHMDNAERIVLVVNCIDDLLETSPFLSHAKQTNREIELYFLNKEEL